MDWVDPNFSKARVRRAGEILISASPNTDRDDAMEVLSNWRAAHAYPMHCMLMLLRQKSNSFDGHALVVQRLKRTPSIIGKLKRFPQMKLDRMQDIGGCRAVLKNVTEVERLNEAFNGSRTRHKLVKINNYIDKPKSSGYRGVHIIYRYGATKNQYQGFSIELQLRSRIQHAWATSVEIVDTFTNQALKANYGQQDWLDFFRYSSIELARREKRPIGDNFEAVDTLQELDRLEKNLSALDKLKAFTVTSDMLIREKENKADYFLLKLDITERRVRISRYRSSDLDTASKDYLEIEKFSQDKTDFDAVLVSAESLKSLKSAYPNYFADSAEFLDYMHKVLPGRTR